MLLFCSRFLCRCCCCSLLHLLRWEVYLCTTADREYAWEAWRLLDPTASIFPHQQLGWRMLCVQHPQKKDLLNVLRKREVDAAVSRGVAPKCASDPQMITDKGTGHLCVFECGVGEKRGKGTTDEYGQRCAMCRGDHRVCIHRSGTLQAWCAPCYMLDKVWLLLLLPVVPLLQCVPAVPLVAFLPRCVL